MKNIFVLTALLFSSASFASVSFHTNSDLPLSAQRQIVKVIEKKCPRSVTQKWDILESKTRTYQSKDSVYYTTDFAVYGFMDDFSQPENGGLTIESALSKKYDYLDIISIEGLCR